ncbi:uncharacterized protein C8R40DRAFT_1071481 [Lentinula edodes]|uniref:uncharacterized protein n=1 Tax=Lentinula edodes TaxID=5353 RepID=UPI001E8D63EA|nr:uncharacterized protein C8R40DRAFT_1071481 [Lentinula edodes]KAH7872847.1 hypothetical protein C8R40DRAFT_1071481 [Lentinula edodes]
MSLSFLLLLTPSIMSSKVRVVSAECTERLRLLEEQALLKYEEVVQLCGAVQRMRSQCELEANTERLKCDFHDATVSVHRLRTEIFALLGCATADDRFEKAITTNKSLSSPPASDLTMLLIEQSLKLDELAGNLHPGVVEERLRKQCNQLCNLACTLNTTVSKGSKRWNKYIDRAKLIQNNYCIPKVIAKKTAAPKSLMREIIDHTTKVQMKVPARTVASTAACKITIPCLIGLTRGIALDKSIRRNAWNHETNSNGMGLTMEHY